MHGVCLKSYENKLEEYLVCHALPSDSCKPWCSESCPSERPSSTPDKQLPSSPCSLTHSSWVAKTGNKVVNTKKKEECCSTQFCVQDVEDVTVIFMECAGVCYIPIQLSHLHDNVYCPWRLSPLFCLSSVSRQARWQPSLASTRASASSRWMASMWVRRATPASSLMSPPAGSTGDPRRWDMRERKKGRASGDKLQVKPTFIIVFGLIKIKLTGGHPFISHDLTGRKLR